MIGKWKETEIGTIPEDWGFDTLGSNLIIKGRIGWKGLKKSEYLEQGYAIINGEQIINDSIDWNSCGRITKERYDESPEIMLRESDILMTKDGTIGKLAYVNEMKEPTTVASGIFVIRNNSTKLDQKYLYYVFKSNYFKNLVESRIEGSVVPHLYQRDIVELKIPFPPLQEQRKIAEVFLSLDDKIALNRSMNSTLEAIGQALFRRWFVDFEFPDEEGKPYRSSGGEMVETELGEVPMGWSTKKIRDLAAINEKSMDRQYKHDAIEYIDISSVTVGRLTETKIYTLEDAPSRAKRIVKHGDTIWSTVRPNLKSFLYIDSPPENLVVSTGFAVLTPKHIPSTFLYHWVTTADFINYLSYRADGSAYPAVNIAYIADADIIFPSQDVLTAFDKVVSPMQDQIAHNEKQSHTLAIIRDALLPKLMSGEIRVNISEKEVMK